VDGKATEAALAALAEAIGVRRRDVSLVTGATSRDKVVDIRSNVIEDQAVAERIARLTLGADAAGDN
jgi:uncharacterized protein YggU (UPF0235/DUF167 family)